MRDNTDFGPRAVPIRAGRFTRMAQLGGLTTRVAGSMALGSMSQLAQGKRPVMRDLLLTPGNMKRVTEQLAKMRGAAMKVGQLVSMDTGDFLPPELAQIMSRLRSDAHFMPPAQLGQVLAQQWPDGWRKSFKHFDVRPIAAASIGQVHRAQLRDGRDMAIKVQYPGVARSIDSDVANVGVLIRATGLLPEGFELAPYLEEARLQLHQETDYDRERRKLTEFETLLGADKRFVVPTPHSDWSTPEILAMDYVNGIAIEDTVALPDPERQQIASRMIDLTLKEMFTFGVMQTDPNFANYRYDTSTQKIVLLDFGATRTLDPHTVAQYRKLLSAGLNMELNTVAQALIDMGALPEDCAPHHRARLDRMIHLAFKSLTDNPHYDFSDTTMTRDLQLEGMALAEDGFVPPPVPVDVLLIQRKLAGMFLLAARLRAKLPLITMMRSYLR